jgi:hypothetical protein
MARVAKPVAIVAGVRSALAPEGIVMYLRADSPLTAFADLTGHLKVEGPEEAWVADSLGRLRINHREDANSMHRHHYGSRWNGGDLVALHPIVRGIAGTTQRNHLGCVITADRDSTMPIPFFLLPRRQNSARFSGCGSGAIHGRGGILSRLLEQATAFFASGRPLIRSSVES